MWLISSHFPGDTPRLIKQVTEEIRYWFTHLISTQYSAKFLLGSGIKFPDKIFYIALTSCCVCGILIILHKNCRYSITVCLQWGAWRSQGDDCLIKLFSRRFPSFKCRGRLQAMVVAGLPNSSLGSSTWQRVWMFVGELLLTLRK